MTQRNVSNTRQLTISRPPFNAADPASYSLFFVVLAYLSGSRDPESGASIDAAYGVDSTDPLAVNRHYRRAHKLTSQSLSVQSSWSQVVRVAAAAGTDNAILSIEPLAREYFRGLVAALNLILDYPSPMHSIIHPPEEMLSPQSLNHLAVRLGHKITVHEDHLLDENLVFRELLFSSLGCRARIDFKVASKSLGAVLSMILIESFGTPSSNVTTMQIPQQLTPAKKSPLHTQVTQVPGHNARPWARASPSPARRPVRAGKENLAIPSSPNLLHVPHSEESVVKYENFAPVIMRCKSVRAEGKYKNLKNSFFNSWRARQCAGLAGPYGIGMDFDNKPTPSLSTPPPSSPSHERIETAGISYAKRLIRTARIAPAHPTVILRPDRFASMPSPSTHGNIHIKSPSARTRSYGFPFPSLGPTYPITMSSKRP